MKKKIKKPLPKPDYPPMGPKLETMPKNPDGTPTTFEVYHEIIAIILRQQGGVLRFRTSEIVPNTRLQWNILNGEMTIRLLEPGQTVQ